MNKLSALVGAWGMFLLTVMPAVGAEFQPLGFEALSMGGAGVASSRGSFAAYYNPALLAVQRHRVEIALAPAIGFREFNLSDRIDTLADIEIQDTIDELERLDYGDLSTIDIGQSFTVSGDIANTAENLQIIQQELRALSDGNGLQVMPASSLGVQAGNFGFGVYAMGDIAAAAIVDEKRLDIIVGVNGDDTGYWVKFDPDTQVFTRVTREEYDNFSLESAIAEENQTTRLHGAGVVYAEIPVAYGRRFDTEMGALSFGGAVKIMPGRTYVIDKAIDTESDDISEDLSDYEKTGTAWGMDLGVLFSPAQHQNLSFGMVMKNINTPEFNLVNGGKVEVDPQVRMGVAWDFMEDRLGLAADLDVTSNNVLLPGYKTRYLGGGINFHPTSWFCIRGGLMQNLKESKEGLILTGGLGFGLKWIQVDLAGQYSTKSGQFDGDDIPRYGRVQLSIVSKWS